MLKPDVPLLAPLVGSLLKRSIKLGKTAARRPGTAYQQQKRVLLNLLQRAERTHFGSEYHFGQIIESFSHPDHQAFYEAFTRMVPTHDYNKIYQAWWHRTLAGEADVCWPGKTRYFALSSGTSEAATKHIPITADMTRHIRRTGTRQILTLSHYNELPNDFFTKGILMLGGSTQLTPRGVTKAGQIFEGDLSGIQAKQIPLWFEPFYKPGQKIARNQDWTSKLDQITQAASQWDIGAVAGVPAWMQILFEKIIAHYKVDTIHDIWPNLSVYSHGGVAFEPYRAGFEKLLARPLIYLETYLASEGFIAYQARRDTTAMRLVTDIGIFYEFVPFTEENFDADGNLKDTAVPLMINQVREGVDYALLLSTCAGAWRYLIGDTVRFTNLGECEIIITGRTKHFLSLCGEHLSVDNMNRAVDGVQKITGQVLGEFAVVGRKAGTLFGHHWYIGTDGDLTADQLRDMIDQQLKTLNDDYRIERNHALREVSCQVLPTQIFYDFLRHKGKEGGQNKFPRVLRPALHDEFRAFIAERGHPSTLPETA